MSRFKKYLVGDALSEDSVNERREVLNLTDETFLYLFLRVSNANTGVQININNKIKYHYKTITDLYNLGITHHSRYSPFLLTYDVVSGVFVIAWEPIDPIEFESFSLTLIPPSGTTITYSYEVLVKDTEEQPAIPIGSMRR